MNIPKKLVVIGGGAAGFFGAIKAAESNPNLVVTILEQGNDILGKVLISGGGRCNVTNACLEPSELVKFYPRGEKELLAPFMQFNCQHTMQWFEQRNVKLKTEADGRIFPISNRSQTIIDCLYNTAIENNIQIIKQAKVFTIQKENSFIISYNKNEELIADYLLVTSGSSQLIWQLLENLGHTIVKPVPSLFTFNSKAEILKGLEGIVLKDTIVKINQEKITQSGAILITHTGLSGPAILKFSAFAAHALFDCNYQFQLLINWINETNQDCLEFFKQQKTIHHKKQLKNFNIYELPNRFWLKVLEVNKINIEKIAADLSKQEIQQIATTLTQTIIEVISKNTNKEEFVTAGGVHLKEIHFKTMESKKIPNLYFAGEVMNIDAVTGGFNFQAAWTTSYIAGSSIAINSLNKNNI